MEQSNRWRGILDQILTRDEYQIYYQNQGNLLQRIWNRVKEWIDKLFTDWLGELSPSSSVGDLIIIVLLVVGLIIVTFLVILSIANWRRKHRLKNNQSLKNISSQSLSINDYQRRIKKAEKTADYQRAIRYRFLLLLFELEEKGLIKTERFKTNWDYFKELEQINNDRAEHFYPLAVYFESVTYGNKIVKAKDYHDYLNRVRAFEQEE